MRQWREVDTGDNNDNDDNNDENKDKNETKNKENAKNSEDGENSEDEDKMLIMIVLNDLKLDPEKIRRSFSAIFFC